MKLENPTQQVGVSFRDHTASRLGFITRVSFKAVKGEFTSREQSPQCRVFGVEKVPEWRQDWERHIFRIRKEEFT